MSYSEVNAHARNWLANLIAAGHIADGRVLGDVRSLSAADVAGAQFHAFAGIGIWSHALREAGWPDDRPVWTGSCPCQPFSDAGRKRGTADERHLWPDWFRLIRECRPPVVLGEQVASAAGLAWFDVVSSDLEGAGYAVGAADLAAASVGAPHIRQRLYFVAIAAGTRARGLHVPEREARPGLPDARGDGDARIVADDAGVGRGQGRAGEAHETRALEPARRGDAGFMGDAGRAGAGRDGRAVPRAEEEEEGAGHVDRDLSDGAVDAGSATFWDPCEWVPCTDGKYRPVEPGTFPLVDGCPGRVGLLRAYGNAICAPLAVEFIRSVMEVLNG